MLAPVAPGPGLDVQRPGNLCAWWLVRGRSGVVAGDSLSRHANGEVPTADQGWGRERPGLDADHARDKDRSDHAEVDPVVAAHLGQLGKLIPFAAREQQLVATADVQALDFIGNGDDGLIEGLEMAYLAIRSEGH